MSIDPYSSSSTKPRFPAPTLPEAELAPFKAVADTVQATFNNTRIKLQDDATGAYLGPFAALSHTPANLTPYLAYMSAVMATPHLTPRERELATFAACSVTHSAFVIASHKAIGLSLGLSEEVAAKAVEGAKPEILKDLGILDERELIAYEVGLAMAKGHGRIADETYGLAVEKLGHPGTSALAQVVGAYLLAGVLVSLNDSEPKGDSQ